MKIENIKVGLIKYIEVELLPTCNSTEKFAITSVAKLGLLDSTIDEYLEKFLTNPMIQKSNIWKDSSKEELNEIILQEIFNDFIDLHKGKFVVSGFKIPFMQQGLFQGLVIDKKQVETLMRYFNEK